jgi:glycosyltransferase involved in cell wall biosynthesis
MTTRSPAVDIVTICKDNEKGLARTFESVSSQSFQDWCLTIVVAESKDNSIEIARCLQNTDARVKLIRQEGSGIYEAMNTGASYSNGDLIWFLNSGDEFYDENTLNENVKLISKKKFGFLVGNYCVKDTKHEYYTNLAPIKGYKFLFNRNGGCHQAMVFNRKYFDDVKGYDTRYKISSDFDLCCKLLKVVPCYSIARINCTIEGDGFSDTNLFEMYLEKFRIRNLITRPRYILFPLNTIWTLAAILKMSVKSKINNLRSI